MSATVRKNFVFSEEVAIQLEEMAREKGQSMTAFIEEIIEEKYRSKKVAKRVEAFSKFVGSGTGIFGDETIQSIKANKDV